MPLLVTALVGLLFLPGSAMIPASAEASTSPSAVSASGDDPSPTKGLATSTPSYTVKLTAYNAVPSQTDGDPLTTASGLASNPEIIAARSIDLAGALPYGTVIAISRTGVDSPTCGFSKVSHLIGYRVVADSMNARWTNRIDVELDAKDSVAGKGINPAISLGVCSRVTIRVVGHIPLDHIPTTQAQLAKLVTPRTAQELALNS